MSTQIEAVNQFVRQQIAVTPEEFAPVKAAAKILRIMFAEHDAPTGIETVSAELTDQGKIVIRLNFTGGGYTATYPGTAKTAVKFLNALLPASLPEVEDTPF